MTSYEKLKEICGEIDTLISANVTTDSLEFKVWKVKAERFLISEYGEKSYELKEFQNTDFYLMVFTLDTPRSEFIKACRNGLETTKKIFNTYLKEMEEKSSDINVLKGSTSVSERRLITDFSKVFIVHGHDGELKEAVARLIEKQGITAIILSEQANRGATVIEKIEQNSDVNSAICLFTSDDFGKEKNDKELKSRARQNVVFETGYFIARLGRQNVIIISEDGVELPSDLQGVMYTNTVEWKLKILRELKAMGYEIDYNKIDE